MNAKKWIAVISAFCIISNILVVFGAETGVPHRDDMDYNIIAQFPVDDLYTGDEVYLIYRLSRSMPVYGAEIHFTYDSDKLELKNTESLCQSDDIVEFSDNTDTGKSIYLYSMVGKQDTVSVSDIIKITFVAKETGNAEVILNSAKIIMLQEDGLSYQIFDYYNMKSEIQIKTFTPEPTVKPVSNGGGGGGGSSIVIKGVTNESETTNESELINAEEEDSESGQIDNICTEEKTNLIFNDVDSVDWALESIYALAEKGIINGYSDGAFKPNQSITRAELAKILCLTFNFKNINDKEISFTDVSYDSWYYDYIKTAYQNGILSGESPEICAPERNVSREEFAAMLGRSLNVSQFNFTVKKATGTFIDKEVISEFAVEYIDELYSYGILNGDSDGSFRPKNSLTRAEAAVGINNALTNSEPIYENSDLEQINE